MKEVICFSAYLLKCFKESGNDEIYKRIAMLTIHYVGGIESFEKIEKETLENKEK